MRPNMGNSEEEMLQILEEEFDKLNKEESKELEKALLEVIKQKERLS